MEENKELEQELEQVPDTAETDTEPEQEEQELVIEPKRYSISYEMFENAYTVFQKKYVYPRAYIMCGLLAALAVANIINTIVGGAQNRYLPYILVAACLALAAINLYNPRKVKRNLMESIRGIENDVYTLEVLPDKLVIGTVLDPIEQRDSEPEEYEEVFGDTGDEPEEIKKSEIYINSQLRVTERAEFFMVYIKKSMFYVIPKHALTEDETARLALYFSSKLGKYFVCEADK